MTFVKIKNLNFWLGFYFYTIFKLQEPSLYIVPNGVPGGTEPTNVGISFRFKQFICVVFAAVLKIPLPTINEKSCCAVLDWPPSIAEQPFIDVLLYPPLTVE